MMGVTVAKTGVNWRKAWVKTAFIMGTNLIAAVLVGGAAAALNGGDPFHPVGSSAKMATLVGWLHVSFGATAVAVRASARFLDDAEEADDLRREGCALLLGAGALVAAGSSLIMLALAGLGSVLSPLAMLNIVLFLNALAWLLVWVRLRLLDELNRAVARDAGYLAITWLSLIGGTWAMLAHLGFANAPAPLDWLTMINGFSFVAGLVALARKGGFAHSG
jgi:hypothetical protein